MKPNKILLLFVLACSLNAHAKVFPKAVAEDSRIRVVHFDSNQVTEINTAFGYATTVEFGNEQIQTVISGDTIGWQIVPQGNRLFIKPAEQPQAGMATTNVTIITDKRNYYLHLNNASRKNPVFVVRFDYSKPKVLDENKTGNKVPPEFRLNNYKYVQSGADSINVLSIFDDGQFTFFEFDDKRDLPAIGAGASTIGVDTNDRDNSLAAYRTQTAENFNETAKSVLEEYQQVQPTITVKHGTRIKVIVAKDLDFTSLLQ